METCSESQIIELTGTGPFAGKVYAVLPKGDGEMILRGWAGVVNPIQKSSRVAGK